MRPIDPQRWARLEPLLDEALDLDGAERAAFLARACGDDPELRADLERMLAATERRGPLDQPLHDLASTLATQAGEALDEPPSRRIGAWHLLETIGAGGMGRVYRAERVEGGFTQVCALKILRWDMASASLVQRFENERQILADLAHPHIARLIDGGVTEEGLPYLAMEYVEGRPIDEVAAQKSVQERLALFLDVADAVQHAHRKLVVHRDLKPSNILVTAAGEVKLLDFGVAKILDETSPAHHATQTSLALATPLYASPEQLRGGGVSTTTDVWALGIVLYQLLTGRTPFGAEGSQLTQLVRAVLEDDPPAPSEAATESDRRILRGDLDTIVLEALRKEPEHRYGSAERMAGDVRRYLAGEPITARPATFTYRATKFARRHRRSLAATAAVMLLTVSLVTYYTGQLALERDRAQQEARTTEEVKSFVLSLFEVNDPGISRGEDLTARQLLDRGSERIEAELAAQPVIEAEMHDVMAGLYEQLGAYDQSDLHFDRAVALRRTHLGSDAGELAFSLSRWGVTLQELGDYEQAEAVMREALAILRRRGDDPVEIGSAANQLGMFLAYKGDYEESERLLRESIDVFEAELGTDHPRRATSLSNLGLAIKWSGRMEEAEPIYREALRIRRAAFGDEHPEVAITLDNLGVLLGQRGNYAESESCFREALGIRRRVLGESHPDVALNLNNLATLFRVQGRLDEAEPIYRDVMRLNREALGPDHPRLATNYVNLGSVEMARGRIETAVGLFEEGLRIRRLALGNDHIDVANSLGHLAQALVRSGRPREALEPAAESVRIARSAVDERSHQLAANLHTQAEALLSAGRPGPARDAAREALSIREEVLTPEHWETASSRGLLGACLFALGEGDDAEPLLTRAHTALLEQRGSDDWSTTRTRDALAALYDATNRPDEARRIRSGGVGGRR